MLHVARRARFVRPAVPSARSVRRPTVAVRERPSLYLPLLFFITHQRPYRTTPVLQRSTAAPEAVTATKEPTQPATAPAAAPVDAPAAEEAAEAPAAEGEQAAEEAAAGTEAAAEGEAAAGEGAAAAEEEEQESYFKETMAREEQQAWENIEKFQKRVAAQHNLQKQVLLKLIREVNEMEEKDKKQEAEFNSFVTDLGNGFKQVFRQVEEKQKQRAQQQAK